MTKVLFVCLGNICRSPLAEAIFDALCKKQGLTDLSSDSAGTASYHIGNKPDYRSIQIAANNNIPINHQARQFLREDYEEFDYIMAMDEHNYQDIIEIAGGKHENLFLLREFDKESEGNLNVPDPYYGGIEGFQNIYTMMHRSINELITHVIQKQ